MKKILYALILFVVSQLQAQEYSKYLPFSVNDIYGLVNDKQEQIVEAKYNKLKIIGAYEFALFDNKYCYNLNNGKNVEINLNNNTSLVIIEKELYVFNTETNLLVSPFTKEKISLQLKYLNFYNRTFYDKVTNTNFEIIVARTLDQKNMFFANTKALKPILKGKFEYKDFEVISFYENGISKEIGIMTKANNNITCFNYNGTKSFTLSESDYKETDGYSIKFKDEVADKFIKLFGFQSDKFPKSYALGVGMEMAATGKFYNRFISKIEVGNGYYLESGDYNYKLKSNKLINFENVKYNGIFIFDYNEDFNYLEFTNTKSKEKIQFFVNHPKINPKILMLPKEKLIALELQK